jgi:Na+/H+-dicarboxylate symporter
MVHSAATCRQIFFLMMLATIILLVVGIVVQLEVRPLEVSFFTSTHTGTHTTATVVMPLKAIKSLLPSTCRWQK